VSLPGWFGQERQDNNRRSRRQEARHAKATGGRVQPGSGSSWRAKEDVRSAEHLDQLKSTQKASWTLRVEDLMILDRNAARDGRVGRTIVEFVEQGVSYVVTRYEEGT
jgi:cytochrome oxidase assembly protein ShyY1